MTTYIYKDELCHYGIRGQKWGVRRFQNTDGSYTAEGRQRRSDSYPDEKSERRKKIAKRVAIGAAVVGGTILAAYGAKKLSDISKMNKSKAMSFNMKDEALRININKTAHKLYGEREGSKYAAYGRAKDEYARMADKTTKNLANLKYLRSENVMKYGMSSGAKSHTGYKEKPGSVFNAENGYPGGLVKDTERRLRSARAAQRWARYSKDKDYYTNTANSLTKQLIKEKYKRAEGKTPLKKRAYNYVLNKTVDELEKRYNRAR